MYVCMYVAKLSLIVHCMECTIRVGIALMTFELSLKKILRVVQRS